MSIKDEIIEAKMKVDNYNNKLNKKYIKSFKCISCKENIIKPEYGEDTNPLKQDKNIWINGTVGLLLFGYGSTHDEESYFLGICDKCVDEHKSLMVNYSELKGKYFKELV